ncbi:hypothetical protein CWO85_00950 [Candidatus Phytoplasma ziziphi]|uniref:DNA adenine methylase n=1 Tax=Ziziphus jujuba witches'-broom phytoplasma TaxID=135727 RepID=A0A660HM52_ZIZJU|nr:DNA adenine methylase [Candidatus Phytoplasma ziziphi]AYJ01105.1 hypothetical protein CWO85_00950 [Candidatus Phytoplasma ziziphi]
MMIKKNIEPINFSLNRIGGKTKMLPLLRTFIPTYFKAYYEPFLGGGALYLDLRPTTRPISATMNLI